MVFEARRVSGEYFNKNIHAIDLRKKLTFTRCGLHKNAAILLMVSSNAFLR